MADARVDLTLARYAREWPGKTALVSQEQGHRHVMTYAQLELRIRAVASAIAQQTKPGDRVLLMFPQGRHFIEAFFGCWLAGVTPVPVPPPDVSRAEKTLPRLLAIAQAAQPSAVLSVSAIHELAPKVLPAASSLRRVPWVDVDQVGDAPLDRERPASGVALIQFTSGSTGAPKGVVVTPQNIVVNIGMIADHQVMGAHSTVVSWLPQFHDMGLIASTVATLALGATLVQISPLDFLKRPRLWLELVTEFKGTHGGSPNFGYDLCVRKIPTQDLAGLDLSSWGCAYNGAEPVRWATLDQFRKHFAPVGFSSSAVLPCYGMAEATLFVCGQHHRDRAPAPLSASKQALGQGRFAPPASPEDEMRLVSCGASPENSVVEVVDPAGEVLPEGVIGEVWNSGPHIGAEYFNLKSDTFSGRLAKWPGKAFLKTGDLGMRVGGELFVTGRLKDLIIVRGVNLFPSDIEAVVSGLPFVRPGCVAAVSIDTESGEGMAIIAEVERRHHERRSGLSDAEYINMRKGERRNDEAPLERAPGELELAAVESSIRTTVAKAFGVVPQVVLIQAGTLTKTTSGKVGRLEARRQLLSNELLRIS